MQIPSSYPLSGFIVRYFLPSFSSSLCCPRAVVVGCLPFCYVEIVPVRPRPRPRNTNTTSTHAVDHYCEPPVDSSSLALLAPWLSTPSFARPSRGSMTFCPERTSIRTRTRVTNVVRASVQNSARTAIARLPLGREGMRSGMWMAQPTFGPSPWLLKVHNTPPPPCLISHTQDIR